MHEAMWLVRIFGMKCYIGMLKLWNIPGNIIILYVNVLYFLQIWDNLRESEFGPGWE